MTDIRQPKDSEGGALLWSVDGTLVVRRTPSGYHVVALADGGEQAAFDVRQDDLEDFIDKLKRLIGAY